MCASRANLWPLMVCSEGECQWHCLSTYFVPFISIYPAPPSHFSYTNNSKKEEKKKLIFKDMIVKMMKDHAGVVI
jgi:hypothetical protein